MALFDRYIAVDWSANNRRKSGKDSIWIAEGDKSGVLSSTNPRTRHDAMEYLAHQLEIELVAGRRTLVGFDFPFGYPAGAAIRLCGTADWKSLWTTIGEAIDDDEDNRSNRFAVASALNEMLGPRGPRFWGCPVSARNGSLNTHKSEACFDEIAEFRAVERVAKGAKSTWQLFYNGSVGSQCLLGIARLQQLRRRFGGQLAIWPFETDFERRLDAPIVLAEIYPSLDGHDAGVTPKDRAQVEAQARRFANLDGVGLLSRALSLPDESASQRDILLAEEGWIVGAGHKGLAA